MCTEKEKEAQKSRLPHSSPMISPNSSPRSLQRQSPVDRPHPVSPSRSTESSRAGSVVITKANSASPPRQVPSIKVEEREGREMSKKATSAQTDDDDDDDDVHEDNISFSRTSATICSTIPEMYSDFPKGEHLHELAEKEPPELPPRPDFIMQAGNMHVQDIEDDKTHKKGLSRTKPGHTESPILECQPASDAKDTEYNRQPPEIPIRDVPSSWLPANSGSPLQKSAFVPKTKRRWLRSPFGHWKGSAGNVEDVRNNRQGGKGGKREEGSHSSTASEEEEQSSSGVEEEEEEEDTLGSIENSLYSGSMFRSVIMITYTCKVIEINSLNDGDTINQHHCQVIIK